MSVCWIRRADGTLVMQIDNPVGAPCSFEREKPGETTVRLRANSTFEPVYTFLKHASPVNGRAFKTWWDTDIEVAWFRGSPSLTADTIPETAPTWAGPVVAATLRMDGFLELRAWTQEAYLTRSVVGDTLINYLITGGVGDYRFSSDTSLDQWLEDDDVTASTTATGAMWLDDTRSALVEADDPRSGIYAVALVPESTNGNYATATVAVMIPTGTSLHAVDDDGSAQVVGAVALFVDTDLQEIWDLEMPDGWEFDRFYPISVQVRQPAGPDVSYSFYLYGGNGGSIRFGRPMFTRPANVGAAAGVDIAQVPAAILDEQVDLVPALSAYDTDPVGTLLSESFRYFSIDHEDATSTLGDWSGFGEWWVDEGTAYWRPNRGSEITSLEVTSEDMGGWSFEVDASGASNVLYGQVRPEGAGASYEVEVGSGSPNRLCAVVQVPDGMGPGDAPEWCEKALEQREPTIRLTGVPAVYDALPGDQLGEFMPGNWMDVTIEDLSLTIQPTVDSVSWDPVSDEVRPSWILGGEARQDPLELVTAHLRAMERGMRVFRPLPARPAFRRYTDTQTGTGLLTSTQVVGEGRWQVDAYAVTGLAGFPSGGGMAVVIRRNGDNVGAVAVPFGGEGSLDVSATATILGPATIETTAIAYPSGTSVNATTLTTRISRVA